MPVAKKVALTEVTEGRPVRARNTRVSVTAEESDDDDFVDAKPKAKATSKATSAVKKSGATKASKKRAHEDEEDVDFESDLSPTKKAKVVVAEVLQEEPKPKKAGPKKPAAAKKDDDEGSADEEAAVAVVPTDFSTPTLAPGELKIVSWNVAGYRAILKKGFEEYIKSESPDIIALQESKVPSDREKMFAGYHTYFFGCEAKSGLHGTALLSKIKPINVKFLEDYDKEGRVIVAEFDSFYLLNTYVPNSGQKLERLDFRIEWDKKLQALFLELQGKKPVIWCGDLNVAKDAIDLTNPTTNVRICSSKATFTDIRAVEAVR